MTISGERIDEVIQYLKNIDDCKSCPYIGSYADRHIQQAFSLLELLKKERLDKDIEIYNLKNSLELIRLKIKEL